MTVKKGTQEAATSSGLFRERDELTGRANTLDLGMLDASLMWAVVILLASRQASMQIGVVRDGSAWAIQYWDGQVPVKEYFGSTNELNRSWAALLRAGYKNNLPPDLEEVVREYGW